MAGEYNTEILIAGQNHYTDQVPMVAGQYRRGQALALNVATTMYQAWVPGRIIYAIWLEEDRTVEDDGDYGSVMVGGPFNERGLLNADGDVIEQSVYTRFLNRVYGFYPRR